MRPIRIQITVDCHDPARLGRFWAEVLGYPPPDVRGWHDFLRGRGIGEQDLNATFAIEDPDGVFPRMYFQRVPEPKTAKNRLHLDVAPAAVRGSNKRLDDEVARLVTLGATLVWRALADEGYGFVMADPEGNEFCLD